MINYVVTLAYDGTDLFGWQRSEEGPTVEEHLQNALEKLLQHPVKLQAASRTDRGVHAHGQMVNFFSNKELNLLGINALLPAQIRALRLEKRHEAFHPTLDAKGKEYHYRICLGPVQKPDRRHLSWHVPHKLDFSKMKEAAKQLEGTFDFSAFCTKVSYSDAIRTLEKVSIFEDDEGLLVVIRGDNFLYKMARTIVGSLVHVGRGKLDDLSSVLKSKKRVEAGMTAPAHGLSLQKVFYDRSE
ncbi:MAG: tRNA pseudouridine synthase A [Chlamydiales bacterium]|nr:tRNA pseudouridine synthase A [Chlamydiales bacterium]